MALTGLTDAQREALRTFMLTGELPHSARLSNGLFQRGLLARTGRSVVLTEAGKRAMEPKPEAKPAPKKKKGAADPEYRFGARPPTDCCVDGCGKKVYGSYTMCKKHLDAFVDGRLLPRTQAATRPLPDPKPAVAKETPMTEHAPTTPISDAALLCIEPGCNQPRHTRSDGKTYQRCKTHYDAHRADMRAEREAALAVETPPRPEPQPPEPAPDASAPEPDAPAAITLPEQGEQAVAVVDQLAPGMLEQLVLQAMAANPEALKLRVTGLRVTFSGEIEIGAD